MLENETEKPRQILEREREGKKNARHAHEIVGETPYVHVEKVPLKRGHSSTQSYEGERQKISKIQLI